MNNIKKKLKKTKVSFSFLYFEAQMKRFRDFRDFS